MRMTEHEVRQAGPRLRRDLTPSDVGCPAGTCGARGVFCGVERDFIEADHQPSTVMRFCTGDYTLCPTWRTHKEAIWEHREKAMATELAAG